MFYIMVCLVLTSALFIIPAIIKKRRVIKTTSGILCCTSLVNHSYKNVQNKNEKIGRFVLFMDYTAVYTSIFLGFINNTNPLLYLYSISNSGLLYYGICKYTHVYQPYNTPNPSVYMHMLMHYNAMMTFVLN